MLARAGEAFSLWLAGNSYQQIADQLEYGNPGNAWRACQQFIDALPDPGNVGRRRTIEHQRLDAIWRLAWGKAETGDVPAMRVLVDVSRRRALLDGLDKPTVLQLDGPGATTQQQTAPSLRDILPADAFADQESVREQALRLHRILPANVEQAG